MRTDRRPLAGLLVGHAVSMTGNMMTMAGLAGSLQAQRQAPGVVGTNQPVGGCGGLPLMRDQRRNRPL